MITNRCRFGCCERLFCPLKLSFAKTIDTYQGQNAGPVDAGRAPNAVKRIICDPGSRNFEARKPGLFFTIMSRATTAGTLVDGKRLDSAFYFYDFGFGHTMTPDRIINLRESPKTHQPYAAVVKRDAWVQRLMSNKVTTNHSEQEIDKLFSWASSAKIDREDLHQLIHHRPLWRTEVE
jgi:hypothetical protein